MLIKQLLFLLFFCFLFSCSKKEEEKPTKTGVELVAVGPVNFGGVIVNESRDAAIRVYNHGPAPLDVSNLVFTRNFYLQSDPYIGINPAYCYPKTTPIQAGCFYHDNPSPEDRERLAVHKVCSLSISNEGTGAIGTETNPAKCGFTIQSISSNCSSGLLESGQNCIIALRFLPNVSGYFQDDFIVDSTKITVSGRGMIGGTMALSDAEWNVGNVIAGQEFSKTITVQNLGDFTIPSPSLTLPNGYRIGLNTCGSFMTTKKVCTIQLIYNKVIKGNYDENIIFNAQTGGVINYRVTSQVFPFEPSGVISFESLPATIVANGTTEYTITTDAIKDIYGNIIADGTIVNVNSSTVSLVTPNQIPTINGKITFTFRAAESRGFVTISLISGEANGFIRVFAASGPPSGTIELQPYQPTLIANGQAQTIIKTQQLRDAMGNVVEDGTQVYYFLQGGGSLAVNTNYTYLGIAQVAITAPTVVGETIIQVRANPIRDNDNNIIGWGASGDYPITFIPGLAAGNIPISANNRSIYVTEDLSIEELGIPIRSSISVGPIRDAFGNIVAEGSEFTLNLHNGKNITYQNQNTVTVTTDANGMFYYIIAGIGQRGEIRSTVTGGAGAQGIFNVWAFNINRISPNNTIIQNFFEIKETLHSATSLPPLNKAWGKFGSGDFAPFQSNDNNRFTINHHNSNTMIDWLTNLAYFQYPCFFSRANYVQTGFCQEDSVFRDTYSLAYNATMFFANEWSPQGPAPLTAYNSRHNPKEKGNWKPEYGAARYSSHGFVPSSNLYLIFGGGRFVDEYGDEGEFIDCPRFQTQVGCQTGTESSVISCSNFSSQSTCLQPTNNGYCTWEIIPNTLNYNCRETNPATGYNNNACKWNSTKVSCEYANDVNLTGKGTDLSSLYYDMYRFNQPTVSVNADGSMDSTLIGDYPPALSNMAMVNNGENLIFAFGGVSIDGANSTITVSPVAKGTGAIADNQLHVFNGVNQKWSTINVQADPNEPNGLGEPSPRYQNGIGYVPHLKKLLVGGGLRQYDCVEAKTKNDCHLYPNCHWNDYEAMNCSSYLSTSQNCVDHLSQSEIANGDFCQAVTSTTCSDIDIATQPYLSATYTIPMAECAKRQGCQWNTLSAKCQIKPNVESGISSGWTDAKDLWELDLSTINDPQAPAPTWKKLCDSKQPFIGGDSGLPNLAYRNCGFPAGSPGIPLFYQKIEDHPVDFYPRRMNMTWSEIRQQMFFSWDLASQVFAYHPSNSQLSIPSGAAAGLAQSFQLIYNDYTGKMFAYKRGTINQSNAKLSLWDTNPNEKHYMRFSANIGSGAKEYARSLIPIVRGLGKTHSPLSVGLELYIYNFSTNEWDLAASNSSSTDSQTVADFTNSEMSHQYMNEDARNHISDNGIVEMMITVKGNPENNSRHEMVIDSVFLEGHF